MNRKRKTSGCGGGIKKNKNQQQKQNFNRNNLKDNPIDNDPDNAPFVDDISELFSMGFVSIEEVDYFDPKKYAEEQALKEKDEYIQGKEEELAFNEDKSKNVLNFDDISGREDSALKSGWTVSVLKNENDNSKPKLKTKNKKINKIDDNKNDTVASKIKSKEKESLKKDNVKKEKIKPFPVKDLPVVTVAPEIDENELLEWKRFNLEFSLLQGLKFGNFDTPMPIQSAVLEALTLQSKRDILGSAPTGSGKTLAFGLSLLNHILKAKAKTNENGEEPKFNGLNGLIIVPTRELAVQIEKHLKAVSKFSKIRIATVVGGLSPEKQSRQLATFPDIVIATPGRLNELMEFDKAVRDLISKVKILILDEADRMIQVGHFKELDDILSKIINNQNESRQVLLFSATLEQSRDKDSPFARLCKKLKLNPTKNSSTLAILNFAGRPLTLQESFALCVSQEDKEAVLFGFLCELKRENGSFGRVLLFANSVDTIRRIAHLMTLLQIPNISLHAQMQQRQRLNNLDRFKNGKECLLIASDVAARGIDISGVDHVIHFHLPKTKDTYVHRCGRTARANQSGTSLGLVAPEERKLADTCGLNSLNRDVIQYTVNQKESRDFIIPILQLARRIEKIEHTERSARSEINWAQKLADECELVLDEDNDPAYKKRQERAENNPKDLAREIENSKRKLNNLLEHFYKQ